MVKFFEDENGTKELKNLDFGIVEVSKERKKIIYMKNNSVYILNNIQISSKEKEINIKYPESLKPNEISPIEVSWKAPFAKRPLNSTLEIEGNYVTINDR